MRNGAAFDRVGNGEPGDCRRRAGSRRPAGHPAPGCVIPLRPPFAKLQGGIDSRGSGTVNGLDGQFLVLRIDVAVIGPRSDEDRRAGGGLVDGLLDRGEGRRLLETGIGVASGFGVDIVGLCSARQDHCGAKSEENCFLHGFAVGVPLGKPFSVQNLPGSGAMIPPNRHMSSKIFALVA